MAMGKLDTGKSNWLISARTDLGLLFLPVWMTWLLCFMLPDEILQADIPLWVWVGIVLCIDVGHVWSTIFRTYFSRDEFSNHKSLLISVPPLVFALFFLIAWVSVSLFWTVLAYLAVYHFVKQQYGFMKIYKARRGDFRKYFLNDSLVVYIAMIFPILYWHLNHDRAFSWFVQGDFYLLQLPAVWIDLINNAGTAMYFIILGAWFIEQIISHRSRQDPFPVGKMLWIITTAFNWYLGIVYFNSDLAFTLTNVVAHGIPYFVLIFLYIERKDRRVRRISRPVWRSAILIGGMIALTMFLAFGEEYMWDMLLYRDNPEFFQQVLAYPLAIADSNFATAMCLALLSMPQVTHYVLDGYIWKANTNPHLKETVIRV